VGVFFFCIWRGSFRSFISTPRVPFLISCVFPQQDPFPRCWMSVSSPAGGTEYYLKVFRFLFFPLIILLRGPNHNSCLLRLPYSLRARQVFFHNVKNLFPFFRSVYVFWGSGKRRLFFGPSLLPYPSVCVGFPILLQPVTFPAASLV